MAITGVEVYSFEGSGGYACVSDPIDTTGKSLIVVSCAYYSENPVFSDSEGNTWTPLSVRAQGNSKLQVWYCVDPVTSATHTFSANSSSTPSLGVLLAEGVFGSNPIDVEAFGTSEYPTLQLGPFTPSDDNALIVSSINNASAVAADIDSGFTESTVGYVGGNSYAGGIAYLLQGSAAAVSPLWSFGAYTYTVANIFSILEDTGPGDYSLSGPSSGTVAENSANFTVTGSAISGTLRVTPNDGGNGGIFTPAYLDLTSGSPSGTFVYKAIWFGPKTIGVTNNGGLENPEGVAYLAKIQLGGSNEVGHQCPDLGGARFAPVDDPYYQRIDGPEVALHPDSDAMIYKLWHDDSDSPWPNYLRALFHPTHYSFPYVAVPEAQALVTVAYNTEYGYPDTGTVNQVPIPASLPLENPAIGVAPPVDFAEDQHALIVVRDETTGGIKEFFELYSVYKIAGVWTVSRSAVKFDASEDYTQTIEGFPTTTAGSTRILPALVTYDDVYVRKEIRHCLRMTMLSMGGLHVPPARAQAGGDYTRVPEGARIRLKASFDYSGFTEPTRVILKALKEYGAILDDNGPNFQIQGTKDARWDAYALDAELNTIDASAFEMLDYGYGYDVDEPESLYGLAGEPSGLFTVTLANPTENVGVGSVLAPEAGFALQDRFANGDAAGGGWVVDGNQGGYRITLRSNILTSTFRYVPASGLADGTQIHLHFYDNTVSRLVPADVIYTIGEAPPEESAPSVNISPDTVGFIGGRGGRRAWIIQVPGDSR